MSLGVRADGRSLRRSFDEKTPFKEVHWEGPKGGPVQKTRTDLPLISIDSVYDFSPKNRLFHGNSVSSVGE